MKGILNHLSKSLIYMTFFLSLFFLIFPSSSPCKRPPQTPGVPPGTVLPDTAKAPGDKGPPSWTGKAFRQGVVSVSTPLAAEVGAKVILEVDRDELAVAIAPAVVEIDRTELLKCADYTPETIKWLKESPVLGILEVMEAKDFWHIVNEILPNTGMSEEEVKNSDSSSDISTQAKDGAGTSTKQRASTNAKKVLSVR